MAINRYITLGRYCRELYILCSLYAHSSKESDRWLSLIPNRYSQKQLYQLVADIPSYSSFIPFCTSSAVLSPSASTSSSSSAPSLPTATNGARRHVDQNWKPPVDEAFQVDAELRVGFGGFEEAYTSRVVGTPWESVRAEAAEAPLFRSLGTTCEYSHGCKRGAD